MLAELSPAVAAGSGCAAADAPPLFVVINAGSGEHDAPATERLLATVFAQAGRPAQFARLEQPSQLQEVCGRMARRARERGGVLVVAGGDGTINAAAAAALQHGCPLGVVPQGTFNYLAREHGIPQEAEAAARALVRGRVCRVQAGLVNGHVFLVNASVGLYPQLLQDREVFKHRLGRHRWVAVLSALATLVRWKRRLTLDIELDGARTVLATTTLFVGNNRLQVERVGLEDEVAQRTGRGQLAGVMTRPVGAWRLLALALRGALGRLGDAEQVQQFAFHELEVRVLGARRVKVATDGEVRFMAPPLRFAAAGEPLRLVVPAAEDRVARE